MLILQSLYPKIPANKSQDCEKHAQNYANIEQRASRRYFGLDNFGFSIFSFEANFLYLKLVQPLTKFFPLR